MNQIVGRLVKDMLPDSLTEYARQQWYKLRTGPPLSYRLFRQAQLPRFVCFADAFPEADKLRHRPAYQVPTTNAATVLGGKDVVHLNRSQYTVPEDYTSILSNALICPTNEVIVTDDRKIIQESSTAKRLQYLNTRPFYTSAEKFVDGYVTVFRSRFHNYYHLLLDVLPRLVALTRSPFNEIDNIQLLVPGGLTETEEFFLRKLDLTNVKSLVVPREKFLYRAEHLIFTPLKTEIGAGYLPPFYKGQLQARLHPKRPSRPKRRIFISRERARRRRLSNRLELEKALAKRGFETYVVEDFSHQEQIELFYDAEVVVGAHGAGLTNVLFSDKLSVVELFPYSWMPYPHYFYLCKSLGHSYKWVWGRTEEERYPHPEYFEVNVQEVLHVLDQLGIR